jgi:hypothetical protein
MGIKHSDNHLANINSKIKIFYFREQMINDYNKIL